jgi:hypothetical protein
MKGRAALAMTRVWFVLACGLLLGACCRPETAVPVDSIAMATVTWFITTRGWKTRRGAADKQVPGAVFKETRQRAGFVFVRARRLLKRNPAWASETDQATLRARLAAEIDQVEAAVAPLVGTVQARGPLFGGAEQLPVGRQHLDLGPLVTHVRSLDPDPITTADALAATAPERRHALVLEHLDKRRERVIAIGWRSAAADDDVWAETGATSQLRADELRGLIDRRLHAVELTEYRLSSGARAERIGASSVKRRFFSKKWHGAGLSARIINTFADDLPNRVIEPPSVPIAPFRDAIPDGVIQQTSIPHRLFSGVGEDPYVAPTSGSLLAAPWFKNSFTEELDWNIWPGTQVLPIRAHVVREEDPNNPGVIISETTEPRTPAEQTWQLFRSGYGEVAGVRPGYAWILTKAPNVDPALEIENLFRPKAEWWWKPWLHADGAFSAVHLEALRFGLHRKTGSADQFNTTARATTIALEDAFGLRGYAQVADHPLKPGRTEWFENATVSLDELQIGDQVLVESLVPFLLAAWWEYPTCLVSNIDVDAQSGRLALDGLDVAGYVTAEQRFSSYRKLVIQLAQDTLDEIRASLPTGGFSSSWDAGRVFTVEERDAADRELLHKWTPYDHPWELPHPWWIRVHLDNPLWKGLLGNDVEAVMLRLPKSVTWIDEEHVAVEMSGKIWRFPVTDDFNEPPTPESFEDEESNPHRCIFVPLYEPFGTFSDGSNSIGWWEFLKSAAVRADLGKALQPVRADGAWVTGLVGAPDAVRVIRPRAPKP